MYSRFVLVVFTLFFEIGFTRKVLVIVLDGLPHDFRKHFSAEELPGLTRFAKLGVTADRLQSGHPTVSLPNLLSIVTGCYGDCHGQISNIMWDPLWKSRFNFGLNDDSLQNFWWNWTEPVWSTVAKSGGRTAAYYWVGAGVSLCRGSLAHVSEYHFGIKYQENFTDEVNDIIKKFEREDYSLALLYTEIIDEYQKKYGAYSNRGKSAIRKMDRMIDNLLNEMTMRGLEDNVNVILLSMYGQINNSLDRLIPLTDYLSQLDFESFIVLEDGPYCQLLFHDETKSEIDQIYAKLVNKHDNMTVYRRGEIPEKWRIENYRLPDIWLQAAPGWLINDRTRTRVRTEGQRLVPSVAATHGWDNEAAEMQGMLMARGPGFEAGAHADSLEIIDVYNMILHGLQIPTNSSENSQRVRHLFAASSTSSGVQTLRSGGWRITVLLLFLMMMLAK